MVDGRSTAKLLTLAFCLAIFQPLVSANVLGNGDAVAPLDATTQLQNSVRKLNAWLAGSGEGDGWRRFLELNVLEAQSALGDQADPGTLMKLYERFSYDNDGLKHPAFNDVRISLAAQINSLSRGQYFDPVHEAQRAFSEYRVISIEDLTRQRNVARYEIEVLVKYCRKTMSSRPRAELFYDLQIDETIEFLKSIEFELPPEFSVGKTESMIRDLRKQLDEVEKRLDELPFTPEPDDEEETENEDQSSEDSDTQKVPGEIIESLDALQEPTPQPDEKSTRDDLERELKQIKVREKALLKQRSEYLKKDKPRRDERRRVFNRLREIESNFASKAKELRDPYFVSALTALERFSRTYFFGTSDNLQEEYLVKLKELSTQLSSVNGSDSRKASGEVGVLLQWLENANQAPRLVTAVRSSQSFPNAYIAVSSNLINQLAGQTIDQEQSLNGDIDGKVIRGGTRLTGNVGIELQDDPNQVHASIHMTGNLVSQTVARQRKLKIYIGANGQVEARRSIYANVGGILANEPYGAANVMTFFQGTSSKLDLVNRIAAKKLAELKSRNESDASQRAESELMGKFSEQTQEPIDAAKIAIENNQANAVSNSDFIPSVFLRSTQNQVQAVIKKSTMATLAAPSNPSNSFASDIGISLHETFLSNYLDKTFSNKTFTDKELREEIISLLGDAAGGLGEEDAETKEAIEEEPFSITFSQVRPIQFEFEASRFSVVVSGRRFSQGNRKINEGLKIILRFKIKRKNGELRFEQDGKAELDFLNVEEKSPKTVAFKSFLENRLNPKEGGRQISAKLPDNLIPVDEVEALKEVDALKQLKLVQLRIESGWLYLGWSYHPVGSMQYVPSDFSGIWNETIIFGMEPGYIEGQ